jgi:ankyrin repeat protein
MDESILFDACRRGNLQEVEKIYTANPDLIHAADFKGFTALIIAAYNDQPELVQFILEKGANPDAQDMAGNTALMGASFKGYTGIVEQLLNAGADVNLRNSNGAPALTFAATFGHLGIAELLLQKGADITLADARGKTPADHARIQENEAMLELLSRYYNR